MYELNLESLKEDQVFKIKLEAYLYLTARKMEIIGKGDKEKLKKYMDERLEIIENTAGIKRPFQIIEKGERFLEVRA
ncbi:MAG: hypothetical protein M1515_05290 [Candidatus Thermoplasmatota archaeon]|nr:hypothetical protein [Candidatus Thermoplasmatota archaeon]